MKPWEVFEELEAKPDRTFRTTYGRWTFEIKNVDGWFKFDVIDVDGNKRNHLMPTGAFNDNAKVNLDWQLVRQPIPWHEAVAAWACGSKVTIALSGEEYIFQGFTEPAYAKHAINEGAWYVED